MDRIDIELPDEVEHWAQQKAAELQMDLSKFVEMLLSEQMAREAMNQAATRNSAV